MRESKSKARGLLKYGCLGCLGIAGIAVLFVVFGLVLSVSRGPSQRENRQLAQDLPVPDLPEAVHQITEEEFRQAVAAGEFSVDREGLVILNLKGGDFEIVAGPAGQPMRVEADFDVKRFKMKQRFTEKPDGTWIYRLDFTPKLFAMFGTTETARVRVILPRGTPFRFEGSASMGESDWELGGLWLRGFELDAGMGEHTISFDEPLVEPMRNFIVDASMGATHFRRVGNASPRVVDVEHSMGEMNLDLSGAWANDSDVRASCSMGECTVRVPDEANIDLKRATIMLGEKTTHGLRRKQEHDPDLPTLHLSVSHSMGELRIDG